MTESIPAVRHWSELAPDPMDPEAIAQRQESLSAARRAPIPDRVKYLQALVSGKRVLDLGVVDHSSNTDRSPHWLHARLVAVAGDVLGIDIIADEIDRLSDRGFNVACMDVTKGELPGGT